MAGNDCVCDDGSDVVGDIGGDVGDNPSCALPQALSSREQAHAGEGRVLSDVVGAPWGSLPGYGVPAFFGSFLRRYLV